MLETITPILILIDKNSGDAAPSFTASYLEGKESPRPEEKEIIQAAAASLYSGT